MKPPIFIIGGSPLQQDLLYAAQDTYTTYIIDGNPSCTLAPKADHFICHDFSDWKGLLQYAEKIQPVLALTMASEPGNAAAAAISAHLNLSYNSIETVADTLNKTRMKSRFAAAGIPTPKLLLTGRNMLPGAIDQIIFPCVVKPAQSSAGRGVKLVTDLPSLTEALLQAASYSADGLALVETFEEGIQYSVETLSSQGEHHILGITREFFGEAPFFVETQQLFPAILPQQTTCIIHQTIQSVLSALNIRVGACHIELRVKPNGQITVIEAASRIGGWRSELLSLAYGLNYGTLLIRAHTNDLTGFSLPEQRCHAAVKMIFTPEDYARHQVLSKDKRFETSPITWLKTLPTEFKSLIDSAGYYFIAIQDQENIHEALQ